MGKNTIVWTRQGSIWAAIAFYTVCGLLLLMWPAMTLTIANTALAVAMCAIGLVFVISYVRMSAFDALKSISLTIGLVLLCLGVLLLFNPDVLKVALPFLWGLALFVGGFGKVQIAVDLKRIAEEKWWLVLIGALLSFILGIVAVAKPAVIAETFTQFVGISLLIEAVLDAVAEIITGRKIHAYRKSHTEA